jgi:hypothetical protein
MHYWLVNHSWESFRKTREYCGFKVQEERDKIHIGDGIVYFGQGLIFGVFEAVAFVENEFNWGKPYPFQVKLKPISISEKGLIAKPAESKILIQKSSGGSPNILELNESEFDQIKKAVERGEKQLNFR